MVACKGGNENVEKELVLQRDSVIEVNRIKEARLNELTSVIASITNSLDSISQQEQLIYFSREGRRLNNAKELLESLEYFEQLLERQRQQISALQDSLYNKEGDAKRLYILVEFLNKELQEKDQIIQDLKQELLHKDNRIAKLQTSIGTLKDDVSTLKEQVVVQGEILQTQNTFINEGYVMIGTKKELQQAGILRKSGLLGKVSIDYSNINKENFLKVDIRNFRELTINSKDIKVLTAIPATSYNIESKDAGESCLRITDPDEFWSITNYLIIQTN